MCVSESRLTMPTNRSFKYNIVLQGYWYGTGTCDGVKCSTHR